VHEEIDKVLNGGVNVLEQDESNQNWLSGESKRLVESSVANEQGK
jgi:hypothetical protein